MANFALSSKFEAIITEYVFKLSDDDVIYLGSRLAQPLLGDTASVFIKIAKHPGVDHVFKSANDVDELYATVDVLQELVNKELTKRKIDLEQVDAEV